MRKTCLLLPMLLLMAACSQKTTVAEQPGQLTSQLDVEGLINGVDLQMDISALSLSDLRILRHAFDALQGFPFEDAYLRGIYEQTSWYDSLMWAFDGEEDNFQPLTDEQAEQMPWRDQYYASIKEGALKYTPEQQTFIDRIRQRENELLALNFKPADQTQRVNLANLTNPASVDSIDPLLYAQLARTGFAIIPADHQQLFHVYEKNDYHEFPSFVTADLFLQVYHLYVDCALRELEQNTLGALMRDMTASLYATVAATRDTASDPTLRDAARHNAIYLAIAYQLLTGEKMLQGDDQTVADEEIALVLNSEDDFSNFIGEYQTVKFPYSTFRPRGHYTRSETLQRFFRAMMWLQSVPFGLDAPMQLEYALQLADALRSTPGSLQAYQKVNTVLTHLMGQPDNLSLPQVIALLDDAPQPLARLLGDKKALEQMRQRLNDLGDKQTRIRPKFLATSRNKVCLMPQRYQPDAEVLQEMVDSKSQVTQRALPKGLDVMAAMGSAPAERILIDELKEPERWEGYRPALQRMQQRMDSIDWQANAAVEWLATLKTLTDRPSSHAPYFMLTPEWDKKSLNAALASWAELKHDAILYAKQPMGAECGGGGPPDPVVKGYVEPNTAFWRKAVSLLQKTHDCIETAGLMTEKIKASTQRLREEAEFLLHVSEKELEGKVLSNEEYDQLEYIGATFENISVELIRDPDMQLYEWSDVQGPDRCVALVADVYTANAGNNPDKSILYEAIGTADEIYVVVEIGGYLWVTRGAVFSYREFSRPLGEQRLTDEEWQQQLESQPRQGVPQWMDDIVVPLQEVPQDNEAIFYSSGC